MSAVGAPPDEPRPTGAPSTRWRPARRHQHNTADSRFVDFAPFYAAEADRLYRVITVAVGDADLAGEAVDEALARACRKWSKVRRYDNPAGWVYRVALNWAIDRVNRRKRDAERSAVLWTPEPTAAPDGSEIDVDLEQALRRLSPESRAVVVTRHLLGYSSAETAEVLGMPEGTVKSRLARALDDLQVWLGEER